MSPTRDPSLASSTPLLFARQRSLLALLYALGGNVGNRDFQKLLFLYCKQLSTETPGPRISPYEFVPYKYGAFSFTCYADRRRLVEQGLLSDDRQSWALIRSEIAGGLLDKDSVALSKVLEARPVASSSQLFTIGYQGRTLESYLNVLIQEGVTILCDVRKNAISRKYGFSKRTLAGACDGVGIRYTHLPELGIESRRRQGLESPADFRALFRLYEHTILPKQEAALQRIRAWLIGGVHSTYLFRA